MNNPYQPPYPGSGNWQPDTAPAPAQPVPPPVDYRITHDALSRLAEMIRTAFCESLDSIVVWYEEHASAAWSDDTSAIMPLYNPES